MTPLEITGQKFIKVQLGQVADGAQKQIAQFVLAVGSDAINATVDAALISAFTNAASALVNACKPTK